MNLVKPIKKLAVLLTAMVVALSIFDSSSRTANAASFIWPSEGYVSQNFNPSSDHFGIDIAKSGTVPIVASAAGVVTRSEYSPTYGEVVYIRHTIGGTTYETVYAHMQTGSRTVSLGQSVSQGQRLGYMGNTGNSYGQHLHFELHVGTWNEYKTNAVDPIPYLNGSVPTDYHQYDGTWATLRINTDSGGPVNVFSHPGYGLKGTLPNGGSYRVYNRALDPEGRYVYYDVGNNTWILETHVDVTPYIATVDYDYAVNVYWSPNGAFKGRVDPGDSFRLYEAQDGWYDLGNNTWIKAEYVNVVKQ